jgi:hypothetical protein
MRLMKYLKMRVMKYLSGTKSEYLTLSANDLRVVKWRGCIICGASRL